MKTVEVTGTFNARIFFDTLAAILSKRERADITVSVTEKEQTTEPAQAAS